MGTIGGFGDFGVVTTWGLAPFCGPCPADGVRTKEILMMRTWTTSACKQTYAHFYEIFPNSFDSPNSMISKRQTYIRKHNFIPSICSNAIQYFTIKYRMKL